MKIENNALNSVSKQNKAEEARAVEYTQQRRVEANRVEHSRDKAEFSDSARLLAKARVALSELSETETAKLEELHRSVQSGSYAVPVDELANRLVGFFRT